MLKEPKTYLSQERIIATDEFIASNNLKLITSKEAKELFETEKENDILGFSSEVIFSYISFEDAKDYLNPEYLEKVERKEEQWIQIVDIKECAQDFLDYMNFAWGKAEDQRGISASRSIIKLSMWLRIMNRNDLAEQINDESLYNPYGAPALISICYAMGIPVPESLVEFAKNPC